MSKYTHIFFDLDHTLWDYDTSSKEALTDLYHEFGLDRAFTNPDAFIGKFHHVNHGLWDQYNKGEVGREDIRQLRFARVVNGRMNPDQNMANAMSDFFIEQCPVKPYLMEGAIELLEKLSESFPLGIVSNGFEDTQRVKLKSCRIDHYFDVVVTSETTGSRKPDQGIFDHSLHLAKANDSSSVMIGDNLKTDIAGAMNAGWDAIWYNPSMKKNEETTSVPEVAHLSEILNLVSS